MLRTVNQLRLHNVSALSWWTFSSIFEEGNLPTNEFGPFGANSALQTVHGVPLPIYRGFQLLADAGDVLLPVGGLNQSGPLTVLATHNTTSKTLHIFLSNFAPDDNKVEEQDEAEDQADICYKMRPNPCTEASCYVQDTDFSGGDLLPESQKFKTDNASACCDACLNYKVDKFCQAWSWRATGSDPNRCASPTPRLIDRIPSQWLTFARAGYLKTAAALSKKRHVSGMTAGYPTGIAPAASPSSWYNASRTVRLTIRGAALPAAEVRSGAMLRMINSTCANPKALWLGEMQSVTWPSAAQLAQLREASEMCEEALTLRAEAAEGGGGQTVEVTLEAYAAAEVVIPM